MKKIYLLPVVALLLLGVGCTKQNDSFAKKKSCAVYIERVQERINKSVNSAELKKVFYSPKQDSCLAAYTTHDGALKHFYIYDVLTNQGLYDRIASGEKIIEQEDNFNATIQQYE